jgi:hypothetical protein
VELGDGGRVDGLELDAAVSHGHEHYLHRADGVVGPEVRHQEH